MLAFYDLTNLKRQKESFKNMKNAKYYGNIAGSA
jgi:hypothetical protein